MGAAVEAADGESPVLTEAWSKRGGRPLASLLRSRALGLVLTGIAGLQVGLAAAGLPGWKCPLLTGLGLPCPGCGLSRAVVLLLSGQWRAALSHHAFSPVLLVAWLTLAVAALSPEAFRRPMIHAVERLERRTGLSTLLLVGLVLYWIARWIVAPETLWLLAGRP